MQRISFRNETLENAEYHESNSDIQSARPSTGYGIADCWLAQFWNGKTTVEKTARM